MLHALMTLITWSKRSSTASLLCFFAALSLGCGDTKKEAPVASVVTEAPISEPAVAMPAPTPVAKNSNLLPASDAERALATSFIARLADAIEADKAEDWPELQCKAQQIDIQMNQARDRSYGAWRDGILKIVPAMRKAEFVLVTGGRAMELSFPGVKVVNDADNDLMMHVAVEEGKMCIDER